MWSSGGDVGNKTFWTGREDSEMSHLRCGLLCSALNRNLQLEVAK